ncbi:MAG: hypothetical protein ACI909_003707 [Planctomycetota bacterium]|jgi:hypothetical protein
MNPAEDCGLKPYREHVRLNFAEVSLPRDFVASQDINYSERLQFVTLDISKNFYLADIHRSKNSCQGMAAKFPG